MTARRPARRGAVAVVMLLLMAMLSLVIVVMLRGTGREIDLGLRRMDTVQAFYASEAGMNMAVREMMLGIDEDGDGGIGTISDDGNAGNDPALGRGRVAVTGVTVDATTTLTSVGVAGDASRTIEATVEE